MKLRSPTHTQRSSSVLISTEACQCASLLLSFALTKISSIKAEFLHTNTMFTMTHECLNLKKKIFSIIVLFFSKICNKKRNIIIIISIFNFTAVLYFGRNCFQYGKVSASQSWTAKADDLWNRKNAGLTSAAIEDSLTLLIGNVSTENKVKTM